MDVNRKWTFCIIGQWFDSNVFTRAKKLSNTNFLASRHKKREKASLSVDVRRSKTSLLKVANTYKLDRHCL